MSVAQRVCLFSLITVGLGRYPMIYGGFAVARWGVCPIPDDDGVVRHRWEVCDSPLAESVLELGLFIGLAGDLLQRPFFGAYELAQSVLRMGGKL